MEATNEEAFVATNPRETANPILFSPSKTWTARVSWIMRMGLIPNLELVRQAKFFYPNIQSPKIMPVALPHISAKRLIA